MIKYGSLSGSSGSKYNIWLDIKVNSHNAAANTSNITAVLKLKRNDGYAASAYNLNTTDNTAKITVGGSVKFNDNITYDTRNSATETLASWTGNVTHNADGTYSASVRGDFSTTNDTLNTGVVTGTFTASAIPRASAMTLSHGSRNPTQDIGGTITAASASFSHTVTASIGSYTNTQNLSAGDTSWELTIPQGWANAVPNAKSGTVSVVLKTKSGSAVIGSKSYSFKLTIPDTTLYRPDFTIALTRLASSPVSGWGVYVQGKSGVSVNIDGESYKYGASYKSVAVKLGNVTLTAKPSVFNPITASGSLTVTVTVTDSRGLSTVKTTAISVYGCAAPAAAISKIYRGTSGGTASESGAYLVAVCSYAYSSCGAHNLATLAAKYRVYGGSWVNAESITDTAGTVKCVMGNNAIAQTDTYEVRFSVTDAFTTTTVQSKLGTAFCSLNIRKGGKGAAFGKYAEADNVLDIAYDLAVRGKCQSDKLWSSGTDLTPGNTATLTADLFKYRFAVLKPNSGFSYLLAPVIPGSMHIRTTGSWVNDASTAISIFSARGTYGNTGGFVFTLENLSGMELSASDTTAITTFTGITEIWGIK